MATGDSTNFYQRLRSLFPRGWFSITAPIRDAVFGGFADSLAATYTLIGAVKNQSRITSASGWFLDLVAWDFFGTRFLRFSGGETDASFRPRLVAEILPERVTANGIKKAIFDLTGKQPTLFEPFNPVDCGGGYGVGSIGYGVAGKYGSLSFPNQIFITASLPDSPGIPKVPGYGNPGWGYGRGFGEYVSLSMVQGQVQDADVYAVVENNKAAGIRAWVDVKAGN